LWFKVLSGHPKLSPCPASEQREIAHLILIEVRRDPRMKEKWCQRDQAERSSVDNLLAANSVRCAGSEAGLIGSLTEEAVRLHNQNRKNTVVSPNESHPNMNA
jgi:hypothetical protein